MVKSRKQELREFFEQHRLFMPASAGGQEAIYTFVNSRRGNGLCSAAPGERISELREVQAVWSGRRVKNIADIEGGYTWIVTHILPKTEGEIQKQRQDMAGHANGLSPYKACLEHVSDTRRRKTVSLDTLITEAEGESS
jgi:hypothetical protein